MQPSAESPSDSTVIVNEALARNDRYLREFIEGLHICPYARGCREEGRLHRQVLLDRTLDAPRVAGLIRELDAEAEIEVGLLIFPLLQIEARAFERFISELRTRYAAGRTTPVGYFIVAFHPELPLQMKNPDVAVRFMRRSPDPTIQLVRPSAIERARHGARDFARRFKTTDPRHVHVHQDDICGISPAPLDGVLAAAGFASDFNPFYIFQNASYPCAHQFVVINKKDVDQRNNLQN